MTATQDDMIAELQNTIGALQVRLDAALAQRNSDYDERIKHQAATIDVLKAMSASPGDTQPVFDLIVHRAARAVRWLWRGAIGIRWRTGALPLLVRPRSGCNAELTLLSFRCRPTRSSIACRAILDKQIIHIRDMDAEPGILQAARNLGDKIEYCAAADAR